MAAAIMGSAERYASRSQRSPIITARDILPSRPTCDVLVDAYTSTFEAVLRILHVPSFLREYEHFWERPISVGDIESDDPFVCKLIAILTLGSAVVMNIIGATAPSSPSAAEDREYLQRQAGVWATYAKQWLTCRIDIAQRTDLSIAQILCLVALVRHVHADYTTSTVMRRHPDVYDPARMCIHMRLHGDPLVLSSNTSIRETEIRQRLWATMVELSLQRSLHEGLQAPLSPESFDCQSPSNVTDEELEFESPVAGTKSLLQELKLTTILVLLACIQRLRLRCLQVTNSPRASKSYENRCTLSSELGAAYRSNTNTLRGLRRKPSNFQLQLLQTYGWSFLSLLHEPYAEKASGKPLFYCSRKVRVGVAVYVLEFSPSSKLAMVYEADTKLDARTMDMWTQRSVSLRIHGQGYLGWAQRQAALSLCLDLSAELEDSPFRISDEPSWRRMHKIVRDIVSVYELRVKASRGLHRKRELVFLASAEAYIK